MASCRYFNPRSPHGERLVIIPAALEHVAFQPTLPARGATRKRQPRRRRRRFQPTLPARGATARRGQRGCQSPFQPTLPARGATEIIFQHPGRKKFQPTLPARGATIIGADFFAVLAHFNPRSPHGERRAGASRVRARAVVISTHAPRTGSDIPDADYSLQRVCISTHAPRTGSDGRVACAGARGSDFNPRSPHGERRFSPFSIRSTMSFQPTLPARGATSVRLSTMQASSRFQPTLPARGATIMASEVKSTYCISTHAPRTGSDLDGQ